MRRYYYFEIVTVYTLLVCGPAVLYVLFKYLYLKGRLNKVKWYRRNKEKFETLKLYFGKGLRNRFVLLSGFLITCLFYGIYFVIFHAVLHRLGAQTTFLQTLLAAGVGVFLGSVTLIPMGLGSRDVSIYGVLTAFGTDSTLALSSVVIIRSLSLPLLTVSGLCYFLAVRRL